MLLFYFGKDIFFFGFFEFELRFLIVGIGLYLLFIDCSNNIFIFMFIVDVLRREGKKLKIDGVIILERILIVCFGCVLLV